MCEQAGEDASSGEPLMEGRGARRRCPLKQPTTTGPGEVMALQQRGEPCAPVLESDACGRLQHATALAPDVPAGAREDSAQVSLGGTFTLFVAG